MKGVDSDLAKKIAGVIETGLSMAGSANHSAAGLVMPTKPLGQDSVMQQISVVFGDSKTIVEGQKKLFGEMTSLMAALPDSGGKVKMELGETTEVDGVTLQTATTKMNVDENDPKQMQAQQMLAMLYGPNGMTTHFGAVNDTTFIAAQGVSDELLKQAVEAAKSGKDVLSDTPGVQMVNEHLPKHNAVVYYIALDNIVSTAVKYAQGFGLPIKMKLPHDLAPIGISGGAEGPAFRMDMFVPAKTVQSLVTSGIQAYQQMQQGNGGGGL